MASTTAVFVSDIHLDDKVPERISRFERFLFEDLMRWDCRQVYLLGDIFNIWYRDPSIDQRYGTRVLSILEKFCQQGGQIEYVVGNRDFALSFTEHSFPFPIHRHAILRDIGGKRFYLCHGDNLNRRDYPYQVMHYLIRQKMPMDLFHALGSKGKARIVKLLINVTHEAKKRKALWRSQPHWPYLENLVDQGVDVSIQGHKHDQTYRIIEGKQRLGRHFILPRWFEEPCGLIYHLDLKEFSFFGRCLRSKGTEIANY